MNVSEIPEAFGVEQVHILGKDVTEDLRLSICISDLVIL